MTDSSKIDELEQGYYYRTIARHFFLHAGSPFLLSARDLQVIAKWESQKIPLPAILEGIETSLKRKRPQTKFRRASLAVCDREVQKAFQQFKERRVGHSQPQSLMDKKKKVLLAVEAFLRNFPETLLPLKPLFSQAASILKAVEAEILEPKLEELEEEVESALAKLATKEEKRAVEVWLREELGSFGGQPDEEIIKTALVKSLRQKYRVPHLLTCYY